MIAYIEYSYTAMLSPLYATMEEDRFEFLPDSTNAVEAYNRLSKTGKVPRPLSVALMALYKKDMVAVLQYLVEREGMSTTYEDRAPAARKKRAAKANAARRKQQCRVDEDAQGPPDRNSDFVHPSKACTSLTKKVCTYMYSLAHTCTCSYVRVWEMIAILPL